MYNIQELTLTYNKLAQVKKEMQLKIHIKINLNLHHFGEGQAHGQCAILCLNTVPAHHQLTVSR